MQRFFFFFFRGRPLFLFFTFFFKKNGCFFFNLVVFLVCWGEGVRDCFVFCCCFFLGGCSYRSCFVLIGFVLFGFLLLLCFGWFRI